MIRKNGDKNNFRKVFLNAIKRIQFASFTQSGAVFTSGIDKYCNGR